MDKKIKFTAKKWVLPGKNCGLCGIKTCKKLLLLIKKGERKIEDCIFYKKETLGNNILLPAQQSSLQQKDILGGTFDFILDSLPGEISARKIVQPFRPDIVEKWKIKKGDIIVGRPQNAGCPVQHVLKVINVSYVTGILDTWCVGPSHSRNNKVYDVEAYNMLGFEGIAKIVKKPPQFGYWQRFLPGFCMMNIAHTGVVNMVLNKSFGLQVRLEDIRLL